MVKIREVELEKEANKGKYYLNNTTRIPLVNDEGKTLQYLAFQFQEKNGKKEGEEEGIYKKSEEEFIQAAIEAPFPIIIYAEDGEVLQINKTWRELTGYSQEELPKIKDWLKKGCINPRDSRNKANINYWEKRQNSQLAQQEEEVKSEKRQRDRNESASYGAGSWNCDTFFSDEGEFQIATRSGEIIIWEFSSSFLGELSDGRRIVISMARDVNKGNSTKAVLQKSNKRVKFLLEIINQLALSEQPPELFNKVVKNLSEYLEIEVYLNYLVHEEGRSLRLNYYSGIMEEVAREIEWLELGQAVGGKVAQGHCEAVVDRIHQSTNQGTDLVRSMGIVAYACYPLIAGGQLIGTLSFGTSKRSSFEPEDLAVMQAVCDVVAIAMERARTREHLQKQSEALKDANLLKEEFLANVSHELRVPLNAIVGWSQLLRSRKVDETTRARALETIERNAKIQNQLISELLDFSRLMRGKLRLNIGCVELVSLIEAALNTVRPAAAAKNIELKFFVDLGRSGCLPTLEISGDADRLQQVTCNVLSNAVKFTPSGGQVEVRLSRVMGPGELCQGQEEKESPMRHTLCPMPLAQIKVIDTGIGIAPEFLPFVFDGFRQADGTTTRSQSGLGLGLPIVRHLVELHGGRVCAESAGIDRGATFTVELPQGTFSVLSSQEEGAGEALSDVSAFDGTFSSFQEGAAEGAWSDDIKEYTLPRVKTGACDRSSTTGRPLLSGLQVLLVEDNADTQEFMLAALAPSSAKVTAVSSAREALAALEQRKPDVLVSDIGMPELDGYALIRMVRNLESERGGHVPAIALTAYSSASDRQQALKAGFDRHLPKPVQPAELIQAIAELVSSTKLQTASESPTPAASLAVIGHETQPTIPPTTDAQYPMRLPLILVVEDNKDSLDYLQTLLSSQYRVSVASDGVEGLEKANLMRPDLIISDQIMPRQSGLEMLRAIRATPELRSIPVIFLTGHTGTQARIESFDAGADDYIAKPFDEGELLARVRNLLHARAQEQELAALNRQLEEANQTLLYLATSDSLTQVANRHRFNEYLETEWRRMAREHAPLSLIMCDIDYFKRYNDTYGHLTGDECLLQVAQAIRRVAKRPADLVARYGGEEFVVVLPQTEAEGAAHVAEAIRCEVMNLQIAHASSTVSDYVTLSLGVACTIPTHTLSSATLIAAADESLYRAKKEGRNRVAKP